MYIIPILLLLLQLSAGEDDCTPARCGDGGPTIRFPFRLKDHQPPHCGYPGFDLSCSKTNQTILTLPVSVNLFVNSIDYISNSIHISDPENCLPRHLHNLNFSLSPFQFQGVTDSQFGFSYYDCPSRIDYEHHIPCLSSPGHQVYAFYSLYAIYYSSQIILNCRKMYRIVSVTDDVFTESYGVEMKWPEEICGNCEAQGMYCRLKSNSSGHETECFGSIKREGKSEKPKVVAGVVVACSVLLAAALSAIYYIHRVKRMKREDQLKIEQFLEDYKALKPARYSYADIKKITDDFKEKLGQGSYGTVYKGHLSDDVHVAVKILNSSKGNGEEFINEVGIIGRIHHINVVRLVGYCADGFRRALIYEFLPNNSLEKFIAFDDQKDLLGWKKLQDIAIGIAKGIEYLHLGCDQRILHFDIKPRNILLDHNLNPKISDFGQAKLCSKDQSVVSMTAARGTIGYIAPEVFSRNFGNVSYKSDVYSFGMLLLEMVGTRKNSNQVYFPEWAYNRLDRGEELGFQIKDETDATIAKKLAIVGLWCIQWYPVDRPSMNLVVQMLEGDGNTLIIPANPFASANAAAIRGEGALRHFNELEVIVESE